MHVQKNNYFWNKQNDVTRQFRRMACKTKRFKKNRVFIGRNWRRSDYVANKQMFPVNNLNYLISISKNRIWKFTSISIQANFNLIYQMFCVGCKTKSFVAVANFALVIKAVLLFSQIWSTLTRLKIAHFNERKYVVDLFSKDRVSYSITSCSNF